MDGRNNKKRDLKKPPAEPLPKANRSVPRGLLFRELGFNQKQNSVSKELQQAAEDNLVHKTHEEFHCELPDVSRSTFLMVFSPDGTKVASTHGNHNVYVTDLNTGKNVNTLSGHPRTPWCIAFHPSSNEILASGCLGGQVRVWDLHGGSEIWTAQSQTVIASLAFHPTDQMLVIATYNELHFWDWSQPFPFTKCYTSNEKEKVRYVAFDPLGHKLITGISNAHHTPSQWDRVFTPPRPNSNFASSSHSTGPRFTSMLPSEQERRITVCYRSLVEQYEQLVQRYYDLSRSRTTPTMDRGTDPMDLSESSTTNPRSGSSGNLSQPQSLTANIRSRMNLLRDNASRNASNSAANCGNNGEASGNANSSSRNDSSNDRSLRNFLIDGLMRRLDHLDALLDSEGNGDGRPNDHRPASSLPRRSNNGSNERRGGFQEPSEQNTNNERTTSSPASGNPRPPFGASFTRRGVDEERQPAPDSTTRDSNRPPSPVEQRVWFSRIHSQAQPSSSSPPERTARFFISQRSAFQPRGPRVNDEHTYSATRGNARTSPGMENTRHFFVHQRFSRSYSSQNFRDGAQGESTTQNESLPPQGLDSTPDVGVRYGIQLLSRHIDNMQRLCRARLEILQLQQIRRMWEDLQRQIRSLHVAVRESTLALTDPMGENVTRRRLNPLSREDLESELNSDIPARRNSRNGESENGSSEQGASHIPSVSEMLELARISDIAPTPDNNEAPVSSSVEQNNSSCRMDAIRASLRAGFKALRKKQKEDTSKSNLGESSTSSNVNMCSTSSTRTDSSEGEASISQSANIEPVEGPSQSTDVPAQNLVSDSTVETSCDNVLKTENDTDGHSHQTCRSEGQSSGMAPKPCSSLSNEEQAESGSPTCSTIPTVLTTTNTTTTTTTTISSSGTSSVSSREQESESSWNRYSPSQSSSTTASPPVTTQSNSSPSSSSSPSQRVWRIGRRVFLRRPRLVALGPRSRSWYRQFNNHPSHRYLPPNIFRNYDCGRKPWFLQPSVSRSQHNRPPPQGISTGAQVDSRDTSGNAESTGNVTQSSNVKAKKPSSVSSPDTSTSEQSSSPSEDISQQNTYRSGPSTSSQSDAQSGPSRSQKERSTSDSYDSSSHSDQRAGRKRRLGNPTAAACPGTSASAGPSEAQSSTQREQSTSESLRVMISRLESLVRQQREQREAYRQPSSQEGSRPRWFHTSFTWTRGDGNSGSDSDSNNESERRQSMRLLAAEERVISAIQNHLNSSFASGSRRPRSGPAEEDWEWTRESTRLRARQVLSLMVQSLTQFFEENGLSNSTSHAVLDEQIYNLYILLQLALELTDLLLAQLVSTRQELEHQWIHHVRSPVALYDYDTGAERGIEVRHFRSGRRGGGQPSSRDRDSNATPSGERGPEDGGSQPRRRGRSPPRGREDSSATGSSGREFADETYQRRGRPPAREDVEYRRYSRTFAPDFFRLSANRRLLRYRHSSFHDSPTSQYSNTGSTGRNSPSLGVNRGESTRRLGPRVINCYSRHSNLGAGGRIGRGNNRPLIRGAINRRDGIGVRLSFARDGGLRIPALRLPGRIHVPGPAFEERSASGPVRPPHVMVRVENPAPNPPNTSQERPESSQGQQPPSRQQDGFTVPLVRVNDVLIPDTSLLNQPRQRPQSPPPLHPAHLRNPFIQLQQERQHLQQQMTRPPSPLRYVASPTNDIWRYPGNLGDVSWRTWRPRFLHPRYMAPNPFSDDNDESLIGSPLENIHFYRDSFIITDAPMSPNHRIQAWDFSKFNIPDISNAEKNVIVGECKIHNDASVDISSDGRLLVTLLPTGRITSTAMLGVYSLEWESLGQCLYTTSFEQNAVSVSLSPASRHLLVGLASRRVALLPSEQQRMAQIFRLEGGVSGRRVGARGRLCYLRDIKQDRDQGYTSLNCIRWAPGPGQGLVYGTNTGKLRVLR